MKVGRGRRRDSADVKKVASWLNREIENIATGEQLVVGARHGASSAFWVMNMAARKRGSLDASLILAKYKLREAAR